MSMSKQDMRDARRQQLHSALQTEVIDWERGLQDRFPEDYALIKLILGWLEDSGREQVTTSATVIFNSILAKVNAVCANNDAEKKVVIANLLEWLIHSVVQPFRSRLVQADMMDRK